MNKVAVRFTKAGAFGDPGIPGFWQYTVERADVNERVYEISLEASISYVKRGFVVLVDVDVEAEAEAPADTDVEHEHADSQEAAGRETKPGGKPWSAERRAAWADKRAAAKAAAMASQSGGSDDPME